MLSGLNLQSSGLFRYDECKKMLFFFSLPNLPATWCQFRMSLILMPKEKERMKSAMVVYLGMRCVRNLGGRLISRTFGDAVCWNLRSRPVGQ